MRDIHHLPVDETSRAILAESGLEYTRVDHADAAAVEGFVQQVHRGFLGAEATPERAVEHRREHPARRYGVVYDRARELADTPIATIETFVTPLTVPGGEVPMWAISRVTVAGTHRRRGIARAFIEGELRQAHAEGVALAGLTASEATIYGRFGFGAAVPMSRLRIDTRRAGWIAPDAPGYVEYVSPEAAVDSLEACHEVRRTFRAGEVAGWRHRWMQITGLVEGAKSPREDRAVRYVDEDGEIRGVLAYRLDSGGAEFAGATLVVHQLIATTDDAARALWHFAMSHDLVTAVTAELRPVDDPVRWMIRDERALTQTVHDHHWLRILDVTAVLQARCYAANTDVVLSVTDRLGYAEGCWRVAVAGGEATVTRADAEPDLVLDIAALSAAALGGVPLAGLLAAGRVTGSARAAAALDAALRPDRAPALSIWY